MIAALQGPGRRQHGTLSGHAPGQLADGVGIDLSDVCCPVSIFFNAVLFAVEVIPEWLEADTISIEKFGVV